MRLMLVLASLVSTMALAPACSCTQIEQSSPQLEEKRTIGFGLFIGIDTYSDGKSGTISEASLHGAVNDAKAMQRTFREFGVTDSALLRNEEATREGIRKGLADIMDKASREKDSHVRVVVFYAGHGGLVKLQQEGEPPRLDSTWVCHDGIPNNGLNQIRGHDLRQFVQRLRGTGAQVLLISDSCHSGTMHRGINEARRREYIVRGVDGSLPQGPRESLFGGDPGLDSGGPSRPGWPDEGFVGFFAAKDSESAYEFQESGTARGRFTFAFQRAVTHASSQTTNDSLFGEVQEIFARRFRDSIQTPQLQGSPGLITQPFFWGGSSRLYARVTDVDGRQATLSMGSLAGVTDTSVFELFPSLPIMDGGARPSGTALVRSLDADQCIIEPAAGLSVTQTWIGRLRDGGLEDLAVYLRPNVPEEIANVVRQLSDNHQLKVVPSAAAAAVVLAPSPSGPGLALYTPEEVPAQIGQSDGPGGAAKPICVIPTNIDALKRELLYRAQVHRLWSLRGPSSDLAVMVHDVVSGQDQSGPDVTVVVGRQYDFAVSNHGDAMMFVYILQPSAGGDASGLQMLYPVRGDPIEPLTAGAKRVILRVTPKADSIGQPESVKVLAFSRPLDLVSLLARPTVDGRQKMGNRGSPEEDWLADILQGGPVDQRGPFDVVQGQLRINDAMMRVTVEGASPAR